MTYGIDLRERVVKHVREKGNKSEASRVYGVSLWCVRDWCERSDLRPKSQPKQRFRKIDMEKLSRYVRGNNEVILRELAKEFGVTEQAIWYALRRLKITHKKNDAL